MTLLLTKEEKMLQDMIDKQLETWRRYGMKIYVEKETNENFRTTIPNTKLW